ncbi:hypothetical protein [Streptomyces sp. XY431]|uniref:hypothetical protein n=1 Tax=Streptomyces sp. XY431 TaxID=1415562 RepID=UPI0006AED85B|nr:hypothetical protein [Streptomyces sp. XY431]
MEITVQWIRTSWTKQSRGGEAAARRNTAPAAFVLPAAAASSAHVVRMHERDRFQPRETREELRGIAVGLREADGRLRVLPRVDPLFGLPPRPRRPPAVRLRPGQWVRWQLNYRFSSAAGMQDWSYWLDTFNIAYGPVDADVFLSVPTVFVDECGPLR